MSERFQLPRIKPTSKQVTFQFLYEQQLVLVTMQNFVRMALISVTELDTKFQNPDNNKRMQVVIDNLYAIIENIKKHPRYMLKPESEDDAFDVSAETYELNKLLMHLEVCGITALSDSIKLALAEDQLINEIK